MYDIPWDKLCVFRDLHWFTPQDKHCNPFREPKFYHKYCVTSFKYVLSVSFQKAFVDFASMEV